MLYDQEDLVLRLKTSWSFRLLPHMTKRIFLALVEFNLFCLTYSPLEMRTGSFFLFSFPDNFYIVEVYHGYCITKKNGRKHLDNLLGV